MQRILLILVHLSPRVGLINGSLKSTVHTPCSTKTHYTNNKLIVTPKPVCTLLAFDKAMQSYGAISCVKMYLTIPKAVSITMDSVTTQCKIGTVSDTLQNPEHLNTAILHHLHYYDRRLFSFIIKLHLPGYELTETCERQVWNNTRSWTVWSAIWGSWCCCCSGSTGCGRRSGPWPRS